MRCLGSLNFTALSLANREAGPGRGVSPPSELEIFALLAHCRERRRHRKGHPPFPRGCPCFDGAWLGGGEIIHM